MSAGSIAAAAPPDRLGQRLGAACVASGVIGVVAGAVTLAYPAAVPDSQWSHPFPTDVHWALSAVLSARHVLTLAGIAGVLVLAGRAAGRSVTPGLWAAIAGYAGLAVAELLSGAIGDHSDTSGAADVVGGVFGVTSLLTALGSLAAGIVLLRRGAWHRSGSRALLASGLVMIVLVTPASFAGVLGLQMAALMLWSALFIPLGRAVGSTSSRVR